MPVRRRNGSPDEFDVNPNANDSLPKETCVLRKNRKRIEPTTAVSSGSDQSTVSAVALQSELQRRRRRAATLTRQYA